MDKTTVRRGVAALVLILSVALSACSGWLDSEKDAIRRAVVVHELEERGLRVDELIIRLSPGEFRADFGYGSRIVWLVGTQLERQHREGEYFRVLDPKLSYLFLQDVTLGVSQNRATVGIVLYLGSGKPTTKEIGLHKRNGAWEVSSQEVLETEEAPVMSLGCSTDRKGVATTAWVKSTAVEPWWFVKQT